MITETRHLSKMEQFYLFALACAQPTSQNAALPSQPLSLLCPFGEVCFEFPHYKGALRRLINLSRNGQATKR